MHIQACLVLQLCKRIIDRDGTCLHADELVLDAFQAFNGLACKNVEERCKVLCHFLIQLAAAIGNCLPLSCHSRHLHLLDQLQLGLSFHPL